MSTARSAQASSLIFPALGKVYASLDGLAQALLRIAAGLGLIVHGWPKIQDPMRLVGMVEGLGFVPGAFWAVALAATEFIGGILLVLGLLVRPAALATTVVLLVTVYHHWIARAEGWAGAEKSILWATMTFLLFVRGAGAFGIDNRLKKQF